jgi:micrococcal nuclease
MHDPLADGGSAGPRSPFVRRSPIALVGALILAGCAGATAATPALSPPAENAWTVSDIVDGDTIRVTTAESEETVRLVGINAAEDGECWADEAARALAGILGAGMVRLDRDVSDRDRFGRLLRYVTTEEGQDAGGSLIDGGHAIARAFPPDTARDAWYRERQRVAQSAGRGLWARDACGSAIASIDPLAIDIEVHPDAAGDDSLNLNDEWVRFVNGGTRPLDLAGWTVRDESSSHRYRFGTLVLPAGGSVILRSGCGTDTDTDRYWCVSGSAVWNNSGDTVFLLDPAGNIVAQHDYR